MLLLKKFIEDRKKQRQRELKDKSKITKTNEFEFEKIEKINDEKIYENNALVNKKQADFDPRKTTNVKFHNPLKKHVDYEKELGHMKKYPRERMAKDILLNTGRITNNANNANNANLENEKFLNDNSKIAKGKKNNIMESKILLATEKAIGSK